MVLALVRVQLTTFSLSLLGIPSVLQAASGALHSSRGCSGRRHSTRRNQFKEPPACVRRYTPKKLGYATRAGAGRIDENSLHAFTLSIIAKGTPLCLGAGRRAVPTLGAYKTAQIWWSRYFGLHPQAWTGSPFRKLNASRQ